MPHQTPDIIDRLAGIAPASGLETLRNRRPVTRDQAQASWQALFEPASADEVSLDERFAVALFVALLHDDAKSAGLYSSRLTSLQGNDHLTATIEALARQGAAKGPYGDFPAGPLSAENQDGPELLLSQDQQKQLGERLTAALKHAHFLVLHPRDAAPQKLQALLDAGWSTSATVTLSQLVSFLAFQLRVISGLRVLATA